MKSRSDLDGIHKKPGSQKEPDVRRDYEEIYKKSRAMDPWKTLGRSREGRSPTGSGRVYKEPDPSRTPGRPPDVIRFPKESRSSEESREKPTRNQIPVKRNPQGKDGQTQHDSFLPRSQEIITVNRDHCPQLTTPRHTAKSNKQSRQSSHWGWVLTIIYSHASCVMLQDHHHTHPSSSTPRPQCRQGSFVFVPAHGPVRLYPSFCFGKEK